MTTRIVALLAVLSIGVSIWLGAIDYETRSVGDLFALENIPALVIFAAITFTMLLIATLATVGTVRAIRARRGPHSDGGSPCA